MNIVKKRRRVKPGIIILSITFIYFVITLLNQQEILLSHKDEFKMLQNKIAEESQKNDGLEKQKDIVNSDEYIEKIAREKLGMIKDNERVYIDIND